VEDTKDEDVVKPWYGGMSAMEDNNGERDGLLTWHEGRENIAKMDERKSWGFVVLDKEGCTFGENVALYLF
jgi:hypothetical protein